MRLSTWVALALNRAYYEGYIKKPINELTDSELLRIRNFGPKALAEVRKLVPCPSHNSISQRGAGSNIQKNGVTFREDGHAQI